MPDTTAPWYTIRLRSPLAAAAASVAAGLAVVAAAEIFIYGDIGESWWQETTSAASFVRELNALDVDAITVRLNSYGGSVVDGIAICNAMKRHKAHITVCIDGIAYSIASLIAMGGDTIEMAENALMMIHAPWAGVAGNALDLREMADTLDRHARAMSTDYASKTGRPVEEMLAWLTDGKDHYFTAAEALAEKLVDSTTAALPIAASAHRSFDLSRFPSHPARAAGNPAVAAPAAAPAPATPTVPKDTTMPQTAEELAAANAQAQAANQSAVQAALNADVARRTAIRASLAPFVGRPELATEIAAIQNEADTNVTFTEAMANSRILAVLGGTATPAAGGYVATLEDETDKQRNGVRAALEIRAGLTKNDPANPFRSYTLSEIARATLERCGVKTGHMDKMGMVAAAFTHSTSDFGSLLLGVANKSMLRGYEEAGETFQLWTSKGSLPDFKIMNRVDLSVFPSLLKVNEGAEYKYATIGDRGETVQLATYGRLFSVTRQLVINDDLDALSKVPRLMGRAAIRTVGDLVYAILLNNPMMSDGKALFHADHKNLAAAGSAITTESVDAQQVMMATQRENEAILNIAMKHLLVPVALRGRAATVRASEFEVGASSKNNTTPNYVRETFDVIAEPRLDAQPTAWYGVADANTTDTIEVSYLDGNEQPTLEQQAGWHVDGTEFKVRLDAGVKALGYRGLSKNPGA